MSTAGDGAPGDSESLINGEISATLSVGEKTGGGGSGNFRKTCLKIADAFRTGRFSREESKGLASPFDFRSSGAILMAMPDRIVKGGS
jgi:hypothetical protein